MELIGTNPRTLAVITGAYGGTGRAVARRLGARYRLVLVGRDEAKVEGLIRTGQQEGAQIAYGGGRPAGLDKGFFVEPTLFVDVDNAMTIARKEFFGPVGVVIGFDDDDEAVRLANDSEFGLGGGVWAKDPVRAYEIAKRIRAGMVYVNGGGAGSSPHTAFGGYKNSGLGLERGEYGLDEFLLSKSIIWSAR